MKNSNRCFLCKPLVRVRLRLPNKKKASAETVGLCILTPPSNSQMDTCSRKKSCQSQWETLTPRLREWKQLVFFTTDICGYQTFVIIDTLVLFTLGWLSPCNYYHRGYIPENYHSRKIASLLIPIYTRLLVGEQSKHLDQGKQLWGKFAFSFSSWNPVVTQILIVIL